MFQPCKNLHHTYLLRRTLHPYVWLLLILLLSSSICWADERIVSLAPNWSHTVSAIGAEHELVGVTRYARFPQSIPDAIDRGELTVVGGFTDINIEKVIALKPSLVLTATGLQLRLKRQLEARGVNVIHMEESSLKEVYHKIDLLGGAINRQEEASALTHDIKAQLAEISQQYQDKPRVKVYYEINYYYKCVPGADSYITELIRAAGGKPILASRAGIAPMVTWEEVVTENPDVILLPTWPGAEGPIFEGSAAGSGTTTIGEVTSRSQAQKINAVINGQVKFIDSAVTKQAGPSIPYAARIFAEAIHRMNSD